MTKVHAVRPAPGRTLATLAAAALAFSVAQTSIVPSLGEMARALDTSGTDVAWTLSGYLVSAAVFTPVMGRLGDIFGKRRILIVALLIFTLGSVVAAVGWNIWVVVAGRIIQGAGGGIFPLSFGIVRDEFPHRRVAGSIGLLSAIAGIGAGIGLVAGGLLTDHASYHWIFWLGAVISTLSMLATWAFVPESPSRTAGKVDVPGAAVLGLGLAAPLVAVSQANHWGWADLRTVGLLVAGVLVLTGWVFVERRVADPLVHIPTLARPTVLMTNVATLFIGFGMFASFVLLPQIAQAPQSTGYGFGVNATTAGLLMLPGSLMMLLTGPLSGALGNRIGAKYSLALGGLVTAVGLFALAHDHGSQGAVVGYGLIVFAGIGLALAAMPNLIIEAVPTDQTGQATGVNSLVRSVGSSLGTQIAAAVLAANTIAAGLPAASGFTHALLLNGAVCVAAALIGLLIPRMVRSGTDLDAVSEVGDAPPLGTRP